MPIENTTYSGVGKPVYDYFNPCNNKNLVDWKGRNIVPREEYYTFSNDGKEIMVNVDDCEEYLFDTRNDLSFSSGNFGSLNSMMQFVYEEYDILPEIIIK